MGIDFGEKKVGIASTDESGSFALPRAVWPNDPSLLDKVIHFINSNEIEMVVMGESKNLNGTKNKIMDKIEPFKSLLEERGVKVSLHPEVYSTMEARQIQGSTSLTDASAAAIILKSYIERNY